MAEATDKKTDKKTVERSTSYPGFSLETVIDFTQTLRKNLGSTSFSRESAAQALGHANLSGQAGKKTAACVHFGMLVREGNTYRQSELADKYFNYTSEDERVSALKEAVQKPTLYGKLVAKFNGQSLPMMLENVLIREYGITQKASAEAAKDFRSSLEYAGILVNGVINTASVASPEPADQTDTGSVKDDTKASPADKVADQSTPVGKIPIQIPGTEVIIHFPIELAYDLSVGSFSDGIKALAENIKEHAPKQSAPLAKADDKEDTDDGSDSPSEG